MFSDSRVRECISSIFRSLFDWPGGKKSDVKPEMRNQDFGKKLDTLGWNWSMLLYVPDIRDAGEGLDHGMPSFRCWNSWNIRLCLTAIGNPNKHQNPCRRLWKLVWAYGKFLEVDSQLRNCLKPKPWGSHVQMLSISRHCTILKPDGWYRLPNLSKCKIIWTVFNPYIVLLRTELIHEHFWMHERSFNKLRYGHCKAALKNCNETSLRVFQQNTRAQLLISWHFYDLQPFGNSRQEYFLSYRWAIR